MISPKLVATFLIILGFGLCANARSIQETKSLGPFVGLLGRDCKTIYLASMMYQIDESKTSLLPIPGTEKMQMQVFLSPSATVPSAQEKQSFSNWARAICQNDSFVFSLYPAVFQKISSHLASELLEMQARSLPSGKVILDFTFKEADLTEALELIKEMHFQKQVTHTRLKTEAWASISADLDAASTFLLTHYTERKCVITESKNIWGSKKKQTVCVDIPRVFQNFESATFEAKIVFSESLADGVDFSEVYKLRMELLSRLATSLFVETARVQMNDIVSVTLGDLKKHQSGHYEDETSKLKFIQRTERQRIEILNLEDYFSKQLKQVNHESKL